MVRKLLRVGAILALLLAVVVGGAAAVLWVLGPPTVDDYDAGNFELDAPGDAIAGKRLVAMACVRCHYDPESDSLAGRSLAPAFANIGKAHASNLTSDDVRGLGVWSDAELVMYLRSGVHPQRKSVAPPYMPFLPNIATVDLANLVAFLRSDDPWLSPSRKADPPSTLNFKATLAAWSVWKPGPDSASLVLRPEEAEPVALGAYLANDLLQCHGCHSGSLARADWVVPADSKGFYAGGTKLVDLAGHTVVSPGLTQREKGGLGSWSYAEFRAALVEGRGKDGQVLRDPMPRYAALTEGELSSLYAYFKTLPAAESAEGRPAPYKVVTQLVDPGRHEFERLGCPSCHTPDAQGVLSLKSVPKDYPTDEALAAYIADPRSVDPGAWMPAFGHLVDDTQMAALTEYVRRRVERGPYAPPPKE